MTGKPMSIMKKTAETVGEGFQLASAKLDVVRRLSRYKGGLLYSYYLRWRRIEIGLICLMARWWNI